MKGKLNFFLLLSVVGLFLLTFFLLVHKTNPSVLAQTPNQIQIKSAPIELSIEEVYIPCEDPTIPECVSYPANVPNHPDPSHLDHEMSLLANGLTPGTKVYVAGCINTAAGARCTTGDASLDQLLNNVPGGDQMFQDPTYQFKTLANPVTVASDGSLKVIVRSFTAQVTDHFFNGYYITEVAAGTTVTPNPTFSVGTSTLSQGTLENYSTLVTPTITVPPRRVRRRVIKNDPKGRLFDSVSLEPIPEGEVALLDNLKKVYTASSLENPQKVKINGEFNFWVPNGLYFVSLTKKPAGYSWPVDLKQVNPNYLKAYYCDPQVKDEKNQSVPLYNNQYTIFEFNQLVHCDLPLDPQKNSPYQSDVKTVEFSSNRASDQTSINLLGRVTHPLTQILVKGEVSGKTVLSVSADKFGFWQSTVNNQVYPRKTDGTPDRLLTFYKKVDLTAAGQNFAQVTGASLDPILSYVEGYAYDKNGQILPLAKVGYRQLATDNIVYITQSDQKGFFKIPSRYLPSFGYELVFIKSNIAQPIITNTSEFLEKNSLYLKERKLDLLTATNNDLSTLSQLANQQAGVGNLNQNRGNLPQAVQSAGQNLNSNQKLIIAITIILLSIVLIVAVTVVIKKLKNPSIN